MKKILIMTAALMLLYTQLYAGNGDLIVNGNLGVGTASSPSTTLDVNGTGRIGVAFGDTRLILDRPAGNSAMYQLRTSGSTRWVFGADASAETGSNSGSNFLLLSYSDAGTGLAAPFFIQRSTGNVGIKTTNPAYELDVAGTIRANNVSPSDIRFKKDIQPIDTPLNKLLSLNGVSYEWKTDEYKDKGFPEGRHYGVIAQEIEKVLPEVVNTAPDGTKSVAYTEIIPVLIEAMKAQQREINDLKALVGQLTEK